MPDREPHPRGSDQARDSRVGDLGPAGVDFIGSRDRTVTLPTSPASPWLVRQLLAQWCREWGVSGSSVDEAMVVVSELVTEFVSAGSRSVTVSVAVADLQLEVAVTGSPCHQPPAQSSGSQDQALHRSQVVRGLANAVRVHDGPDGRTVVVDLTVSRAP